MPPPHLLIRSWILSNGEPSIFKRDYFDALDFENQGFGDFFWIGRSFGHLFRDTDLV